MFTTRMPAPVRGADRPRRRAPLSSLPRARRAAVPDRPGRALVASTRRGAVVIAAVLAQDSSRCSGRALDRVRAPVGPLGHYECRAAGGWELRLASAGPVGFVQRRTKRGRARSLAAAPAAPPRSSTRLAWSSSNASVSPARSAPTGTALSGWRALLNLRSPAARRPRARRHRRGVQVAQQPRLHA